MFSYYKKNEINRDKNGLLDNEKFGYLSEKEVFQSEHKDIIPIESISAKCKVSKLKSKYKLFFCKWFRIDTDFKIFDFFLSKHFSFFYF